MSHECYMNVTFRFCFRSPLKSLKLPVFKGLSTDLGSHSFLHISFYPLYIKVYDADGNLLSTEDFDNATVGEYDATKTIHYPAWQNAATFEIVEEPTTGISNIESANVAKDGKCFNLAGQQVGKNYKGVVIKNGKKMVIK